MKSLLFLPDPGSSSEVFYKIDAKSGLIWGAFGPIYFRKVKYSDTSVIESVEIPAPGIFVDTYYRFENIQHSERFLVSVTNGSTTSWWDSGATAVPNPGYATSIQAAVSLTPL